MTAPRFMAMLVSAGLAGAAGAASADYKLTLLHFNDFHSRLEPINKYDGSCPAEDDAAGECFGGAARMKTFLDSRRADLAGQNVLVLSAGDAFQGTLYYTTYKGSAEAEAMNALGLDAMAVGNHEFDDGPAALSDFIAAVEFPVISGNTNVTAEALLAGKVPGYVVLEEGGEKIGVISVLATDTNETAAPGPNISFEDEIAYLGRVVPELEAQGVNKIILLSHVGFERDQQIAAAAPGIDVIVGGHSHTFLSASDEKRAGPYPVWANGPEGALVPIVQAYAYSKYIGEITVDFDDTGKVLHAQGDTILLDKSIAPDPAIAARVAELGAPIEELKNKVVAETAAAIGGDRANCRAQECEMGVLVTDAMLDKTAGQGVTIAFANGGGLRASIDAGPVTMGEVLTVLPFQNTIATMQLKGADIVEALENGVSKIEEGAGRFPQLAGLRFAYDPAGAPGARVRAAEIPAGEGWAPIDPEADYLVVTNNYMRGGGDGYAVFRDKAVKPYDYGPNLEEAVADYLARHSPYQPKLRGGIIQGESFAAASTPAQPPAPEAAPAAPAQETAPAQVYVVKPGDTLWAIAQTMLGDATLYTKIIEENGLASGAVLSIGQELKLPQ